MKAITTIQVFFILWVCLCSCPYSSQYKLDENPNIYVEDALLGNWAVFVTKPGGKEVPVKMILGKKSETEYTIAFTGQLEELKPFRVLYKDTIAGTAFMSTVAGKQFFNISIKGMNYIAELKLKDEKLSLLPLSEHFTAKMIQNNSELRNSLEFHCRTRVHPVYDEDFSLIEMIKVN